MQPLTGEGIQHRELCLGWVHSCERSCWSAWNRQVDGRERAKGEEGQGQDLVKNLGCVERGRASKDTEDSFRGKLRSFRGVSVKNCV